MHRKLNHKFLLASLSFLLMVIPTHARADENVFTVFLNDYAHYHSEKVRPCLPVMAHFYHPNPAVTRIRMRYPRNHAMHMFFDINEEVHIKLHEDYMRKSMLSYSDFLAEDDAGNVYGQMTLTFIPLPTDAHAQACEGFVNS